MFSSKLPKTPPSIFSLMSHLSNEHEAINLSQGFPDFPVSPELIRLVHQFMEKGHNQYAPMAGLASLRKVISQKVNKSYGCDVDWETEITITPGATEAIFTSISTVVNPGDEVIVLEPCYDSYVPSILLNQGIPRFSKLTGPDFRPNWSEIRSLISSKTKLIIINNPHNPTGAVLLKEDLDELASITRDKNIYILSDEVYEHITFDHHTHTSILSHEELIKKSFATFSFGKTFHATGWKIGYCIAPKELMEEFQKLHQFITFSTHTPSQHALATFIKDEQNYTSLSSFFERKRDLFLKELQSSSFEFTPSKGTYFQLLNYSTISSKDDLTLAQEWVRQYGIASIPISVFYHDQTQEHYLRFCFAKEDRTLKLAAQKLCQI